jgi:hypothetical protein
MQRADRRRAPRAALFEEEGEVGDDRAGEREQDAELNGQNSVERRGGASVRLNSLSTGRRLRLRCDSHARDREYRRGMRAKVSAAAVLLTPVILALSVTGAGAAGSCAPAGTRILAGAGSARLYSQGGELYGCLAARRTRLGALSASRPFPATKIALYALSGRYAAFDRTDMGVDTFASTVALVDLRSGATIASAPGTTPANRPESFITVGSMVVDARGTLAWIGERRSIGVLSPTVEVHTLSAAGAKLLASASDIAARSLKLNGEMLTWREGGKLRSRNL